MPATFAFVRRCSPTAPKVPESIYHGTPTFYVRKKLILRMREDGGTLVCNGPMELREQPRDDAPDALFLNAHYRNYPAELINLNAVKEGVLKARNAATCRPVIPQKWIAHRPRPT